MTAVEFDSDHSRDYLRSMYAQHDGYIQICGTGNWAGKVFATDDIDNAVDYAMYRDKVLDRTKPGGVYHRCTLLKEPLGPGKRGTAEDTLAVPFFWSDIDFGTDGHKPSRDGKPNPPTAEDARPLVAEAGLPEPSVWVHSGGGWYALWVPSWTIEVSEAARISVNIQLWLQEAAGRQGWAYGTGVGDLPRVIRLAGSLNRKLPLRPRPCRVVGGTGKVVDRHALPTMPPEKLKSSKSTTSVNHPPRRAELYPPTDRPSVADALNLAEWADILEPWGWTYIGTDSGEKWLRPGGADSEYSARAFEFNLVVHSEEAGLPSGKGRRLTKFRVWSWLNGFDEDGTAAARALIKGEHDLPSAVGDAIKAAAESWAPTVLLPAGAGAVATDVELASWLHTFTANRRLDRFARHISWMLADPPTKLLRHAERLVVESIAGNYSAESVVVALAAAHQHHGLTDPELPRQLLSAALGSALAVLGEVAA